jgi:universal stress protein A
MVKQVVVAIDFSENSRLALDRAAELARLLKVPLTAVHVVEGPSLSAYSIYAPMGDPAWYMDVQPNAGAVMDTWLAPYPEAKGMILGGSPAEQILGTVDKESLLVVGQVGHSILEHLLFGSTATKVVRHAPCDVLVVRHPKT